MELAEKKYKYLDLYLKNTQGLLQALQDNDLEAILRCVDQNDEIIRRCDLAGALSAGTPEGESLKKKMEAVLEANKQCFCLAEKKCRSLKTEIERTDKGLRGVNRYGIQPGYAPKFIDNRT